MTAAVHNVLLEVERGRQSRQDKVVTSTASAAAVEQLVQVHAVCIVHRLTPARCGYSHAPPAPTAARHRHLLPIGLCS